MKKIRLTAITFLSVMLLGLFIPASTRIASATEIQTDIEQIANLDNKILDINNQQMSPSVLNDSQQKIIFLYTYQLSNEYITILRENVLERAVETPLGNRGAGSLMAHLLLRYSKNYILKTLPKLLYKKVTGVIGSSISEATFVRIWGNVIGIATLSNIGSLVTKGLANMGLTGWLADAIGNAIQIAIDVFV